MVTPRVSKGAPSSTVMVPVDASHDSAYSSFDGERSPRCNGHYLSYDSWKEDNKLWNESTELDEKKRAIVIIGQLDGEPKRLVKTIKPTKLCKPNGVETFIEFLDNSFALSKEDRTDADLMELPDW